MTKAAAARSNGATAENAAGSQAVARARQHQQQQTRLLRPHTGAGEPSGETKAATEDTAMPDYYDRMDAAARAAV